MKRHLQRVAGRRDAKICDLSAAGVYIALEPVPDVGEGFTISFSFALPGRDNPLKGFGPSALLRSPVSRSVVPGPSINPRPGQQPRDIIAPAPLGLRPLRQTPGDRLRCCRPALGVAKYRCATRRERGACRIHAPEPAQRTKVKLVPRLNPPS